VFAPPSTKFVDIEGGERCIIPGSPRTGRTEQFRESDSEGKERRRHDNQHLDAVEVAEENIFITESIESQIVVRRLMEGQGEE